MERVFAARAPLPSFRRTHRADGDGRLFRALPLVFSARRGLHSKLPVNALLHITTASTWERAKALGTYRAPSLDAEGFIHLSTSAQWRKTAGRFFKGQSQLVLLELDPTGLDVRFEPADGDLFPHLYGALPVSAVLRTTRFDVSALGEVAITSAS